MTDEYFGKDTKEWKWTNFKSTKEYPVSPKMIDWIIGQDKALTETHLCIDEWITKLLWLRQKKWWKPFENPENDKPQLREYLPAGPFLLLLGDAGTGKSLLGRALANYMTEEYKKHNITLYDVLAWRNRNLPSEPKISIHPAGKGKDIVFKATHQIQKKSFFQRWGLKLFQLFCFGLGFLLLGIVGYFLLLYGMSILFNLLPLLMAVPAPFFFGFVVPYFAKFAGSGGTNLQGIGGASSSQAPKLLIDNSSGKVPFIDATGHGSAQLYGSIAWNPYQCTPKGQVIITNHGLKYLEECAIEDEVLGQDGKWKKVTDAYSADHDADVVCIKGVGIPLLKVTKCHPIYVKDKLEIPEWKLATQLDGTEILFYPKLQITKDIEWITNDLAYLFGLWVADGYILDGKQVRICIGNYQIETNKIFENLLNRLGLSFGKEKYNNAIRYNIYSANLVRLIESIFGKCKNAFTKEIPIEIILLPKEKALSFIRGYIDGDGGKEKERITTSSVSDKLSRGFQFMLVKNNLWGNYRRQNQKGKVPRYEIQITKQYASKLYPSLYIWNGKSSSKRIEREKWFEIPIKKIWTEHYKGKIYDVTSEDGCFSAPFLVHNTGGLGTPEHQRISAGDVHRAHLGVLFIDEIKNLTGPEAITLLTVLEDGQLPVALRSLFHGGDTAAMAVSSEPIPAMFFFIGAGNLDSLPQIHAALLDRIQGYGKVVYMNNDMSNTIENRRKFVQFIAQEIQRFHLLPFDRDACKLIVDEARRKSGKKDYLTCKFRPMISVIKTASTLAMREGLDIVNKKHVEEAIKEHCKTIGLQVMEKHMENQELYSMIDSKAEPKIGQIHGLAVSSINREGADMVGSVLAIRASAVKKEKKQKKEGYFHVTGVETEEESWVQHSILKVRHVIHQLLNIDIGQEYCTHVDFAQEHGVEGPSAGVAMALAVYSALTGKKIRQDVVVTGEINIGVGNKILVTPIGGTHEKILAAEKMGFKTVIIPKRNYEKNINPSDYKINIVGAETLEEYMRAIFVD